MPSTPLNSTSPKAAGGSPNTLLLSSRDRTQSSQGHSADASLSFHHSVFDHFLIMTRVYIHEHFNRFYGDEGDEDDLRRIRSGGDKDVFVYIAMI